jgi:transposase
LLVRPAADRTATQQKQVDRLLEASADLAVAQTLAQEFGSMIREQRRAGLDSWLDAACASSLDDLISFAHGIQQTYAEVAAALELPWSNGPVEGHVNRLKTLKRGMYGRATFAVLRARVVHRPERRGRHQKCA